jgi:5'-deoxynucleotidase YfbR-like HD superfamily hydrolase
MGIKPRQVAANRKAAAAPRAWQRMLSGRRLDLLDPSPVDIALEDIAHGLARVARWNGQTVGPYPFSVAQHSVVVEELCVAMAPGWPARWRLAALLHDASEYVIGDMISPFKAALGMDYKTFEDRLTAAIHMHFGLPVTLPGPVKTAIKRADRYCAYLEATQLAGFALKEAQTYFTEPPSALHRLLTPLAPQEAQAALLARCRALLDQGV